MSAVQSPLFEPVLWQEPGFQILDELQVPGKIEYLKVTEVAQALDAVREMKTRAFGQVLTFLYSGALVAQNYSGNEPAELGQQLARMTEQFCAARPTFDFRGIGRFFEPWLKKSFNDGKVGANIAKQARQMGQQIVAARRGRAKRAAEMLPNPTRLLTHCNISGELVAVARRCQEIGKEFSVVATETRPYLQGARLTAWELVQAGVPVTLIPDSAVAQVMARGQVNGVIVGADRIAQNGDVINKVGTYTIARLAKEYGVPFYALVQDPHSLRRGSDVPIEERPADELLLFQGEALLCDRPAALQVRYLAFDVTPAEYITNLIGFDDLYTPETFRRRYQTEVTAEHHAPTPSSRYLLIFGVPPKNQYPFLLGALKAERAASFLVPEMRPRLWGTEIVAPELLARNAPTTLISDNMMGTLFAQGEIAKLCLFYDELCEAGPRGICGSLLAVQLARVHKTPIELFAGAQLDHETRDRDVATFMGKPICPVGVAVYPVQSEVVPWNLLKG
jgi:methylthioribose-1-phosphate isomerase